MNICTHKHDEIVYEGNSCPLCEANDELKELRKEIQDLLNRVAELEESE